MKKILLISMSLILLFSFTSCGEKQEQTSTVSQTEGARVDVVSYYDNYCTSAKCTISPAAKTFLAANEEMFRTGIYNGSGLVEFDFDKFYETPDLYGGAPVLLENLQVISSVVVSEGAAKGVLLQLTDGVNGYAVYLFGTYPNMAEGNTVSIIALPLSVNTDESLGLFAGICFE